MDIRRFLASCLCRVRGYNKPSDYSPFLLRFRVPYRIDLESHIEKFLKPDHELEHMVGYELFLAYGQGYDANFFEICLDGMYGFVLTSRYYHSVRLEPRYSARAVISFDIVADTVVVKQIQSVKNRAPSELRWEKIMLALATDWALAQGYHKIGVIRAEDHRYYLHTRPQDLYMHYDVTAKRSGFRWDGGSKLYIKNLASEPESAIVSQ